MRKVVPLASVWWCRCGKPHRGKACADCRTARTEVEGKVRLTRLPKAGPLEPPEPPKEVA